MEAWLSVRSVRLRETGCGVCGSLNRDSGACSMLKSALIYVLESHTAA